MNKTAKHPRIGTKVGHLVVKSGLIKYVSRSGTTKKGYECLCSKCGVQKPYDYSNVRKNIREHKNVGCLDCSIKERTGISRVLSKKDVSTIYERFVNQNISRKQLANLYDVSDGLISDILNGKRGLPKLSKSFLKRKGIVTKGKIMMMAARTRILTPTQVLTIRKQYKSGKYSHEQLGNMYGVTGVCIHYIVTGKSWKHLK